jgi:hypothetical protein
MLLLRMSICSSLLMPRQLPTFDVTGLVKSELSLQERFDLCRSVGEECIQVCRVLPLSMS